MDGYYILMVIWVLIAHYLSDVLFQKDEWQENKHKDISALLKHTITYTLMVCLMLSILFNNLVSFIWFFSVTFFSHLLIDFFTSRIDNRLKNLNRTRYRVKLMLFDQLMHKVILFISIYINYG